MVGVREQGTAEAQEYALFQYKLALKSHVIVSNNSVAISYLWWDTWKLAGTCTFDNKEHDKVVYSLKQEKTESGHYEESDWT